MFTTNNRKEKNFRDLDCGMVAGMSVSETVDLGSSLSVVGFKIYFLKERSMSGE